MRFASNLHHLSYSTKVITKIACFLYSFERFASNFGFEIIPKSTELLVQLRFSWYDSRIVSMKSIMQSMEHSNALMSYPFTLITKLRT